MGEIIDICKWGNISMSLMLSHGDSDKLCASGKKKDRLKCLVIWTLSNNLMLHRSFKLCDLSIRAIKMKRWCNICLHFRERWWHEWELINCFRDFKKGSWGYLIFKYYIITSSLRSTLHGFSLHLIQYIAQTVLNEYFCSYMLMNNIIYLTAD